MPKFKEAAGKAQKKTPKELIEAMIFEATDRWAKDGIEVVEADLEINELVEEIKEKYGAKNTPGKCMIKSKLKKAIERQKQRDNANVQNLGDPLKDIGDPMQRYAVVTIGGTTRVFDRNTKSFMRRREFEDLFAHIPAPEEDMSYGSWWFSNPRRPSYMNGVAMVPDGTTGRGVLNLWQGWGVEESKGDWSLFKRHLLDVICRGNETDYGYLIKWLAWVIQNPGLPAETVVVLRGGQGTGKGLINRVMAKIMNEEHSFECSNSQSMVGSFTAWMRDCLWLFVDEAFFADGSKRSKGRLKSLITEKRVSVNQKNVDEVMVENTMAIMMGTNMDWAVPVDWDDRRFFILNVLDDFKNDPTYFEPLWKHLFEEGGVEAFFHDMREMDLEDWHPRKIHMTDEKRRQVSKSLTVAQRWLMTILQKSDYELVDNAIGRGEHVRGQDGRSDALATWMAGYITVETWQLTRSFEVYAYGKHEGAARRCESGGTVGQVLTSIGVEPSQVSNNNRVRTLPRLPEMRENFARKFFNCSWDEMLRLIEWQ